MLETGWNGPGLDYGEEQDQMLSLLWTNGIHEWGKRVLKAYDVYFRTLSMHARRSTWSMHPILGSMFAHWFSCTRKTAPSRFQVRNTMDLAN